MRAKITREAGWKTSYLGKRIIVPFDTVLNGDLAAQAISEKAAERVPYSEPTSPTAVFKSVRREKKDLGAAPENKAE